MHLGQKNSVVSSSLGVKNSKPTKSLGVKSHAPQLDADLIKSYTSDGIIINESNSNNTQREPILGVKLQSHKVNHNKNYLEKASKIRNEKSRNHFA